MSIRRYVRSVENMIYESLVKRRDDKEGKRGVVSFGLIAGNATLATLFQR